MDKFDIKRFLSDNRMTEVSQINELRTRLKEVKGSETKEGKEIIDYFQKNLGLGKAGKELLIKNLDNANPHSIRSAYKRVNTWKDDNYRVTPQDLAIMNNTLEG